MRRTSSATTFPRSGPLLALLLSLAVFLAFATQAQSGDPAPTVSIESPTEGATVNGTVDVSGTASAPNGSVDEVEVRIDGGAWATATGTESWSYAWDTTAESEGDHAVEARSWSGNNSSAIDVVNVTVDNEQPNEAPTVSIDQPAEGATVNGSVDVSGTASDPDGSIENVEVRIDGGTWQQASGTSSWSYAWDSSTVDDGRHTIEARAHDANTTSKLDAVNVTVDNEQPNEAPTVSIDDPSEGATVSGTTDLSGTASDPDGSVSSVEVRVDGGTWQQASGTSSWSYAWDSSTVDDGQHTIEARAHDADTASRIDAVNVTVDNGPEPNDPPTVSVGTPSEGATVTGTIEVAGTASDPDGSVSSVEVRIDGGGWLTADGTGNWHRTWDTTNVQDGRHTIEARAHDGSTYSTIADRNVSVDNSGGGDGSTDENQPPSVTLDRPADGATVEGTVQVEGRTWDSDGQVVRVELRVDGGSWRTASGTGSWSLSWNSDQVDEGEHTLTARAFDDDGARNTAWTRLTVNRTSADAGGSGDNDTDAAPNEPPTLTVVEPEQNETVSGDVLVSGTASDPEGELADLEMQIDDWGWRTHNASTSWVQRWNMTDVPGGEHVLTIRVTDAEGASDVVVRRIQVASDGEALEPASRSDGESLQATNASAGANEASPSVELSSPADGTDVEGELTLEGVATDADDPSSLVVEYRVDGGDWQALDVEPGETFERTIPTSDLSPGEHELRVRAHDGVHWSQARTAAFTVPGASGAPTTLAALVVAIMAGGGLIVWARHTDASG